MIGDGALTGGMAWEALNNIAAGRPPRGDRAQRQRPLLLADHRRHGRAAAALRLRPGYERMLGRVKDTLPRTPVVGRPLYAALHAAKSAVKDWCAAGACSPTWG